MYAIRPFYSIFIPSSCFSCIISLSLQIHFFYIKPNYNINKPQNGKFKPKRHLYLNRICVASIAHKCFTEQMIWWLAIEPDDHAHCISLVQSSTCGGPMMVRLVFVDGRRVVNNIIRNLFRFGLGGILYLLHWVQRLRVFVSGGVLCRSYSVVFAKLINGVCERTHVCVSEYLLMSIYTHIAVKTTINYCFSYSLFCISCQHTL